MVWNEPFSGAAVRYWTQFNDFTLLWWQTLYSYMVAWVPYFDLVRSRGGEADQDMCTHCCLAGTLHEERGRNIRLLSKNKIQQGVIYILIVAGVNITEWVAILTCIWLSVQKFDIQTGQWIVSEEAMGWLEGWLTSVPLASNQPLPASSSSYYYSFAIMRRLEILCVSCKSWLANFGVVRWTAM